MVIFGTGVITGALVVGYSGHPRPFVNPRESTFPRPPQPFHGVGIPQTPEQKPQFMERLQRELNLTPEQHDRIEKIVNEGQLRTKELWEQVAPQIRQESQRVRERIRAELTSPEQKRRFGELLKQRPPLQDRRPRDLRRQLPPPQGNPPQDGGPQQPPPGGQPPPPENP